MSEQLDPIVEAAAEALAAYQHSGDASMWRIFTGSAEAVVAAVAPRIRRQAEEEAEALRRDRDYWRDTIRAWQAMCAHRDSQIQGLKGELEASIRSERAARGADQ